VRSRKSWDKTRLIEFGRFAAQNCKKRGLAKPETFQFLGFMLICGKSRRGDFQIRRKSRQDRMRATLWEIKEAPRQRRHVPVPEVGRWLAQVVAGYFAYHAVPTNRGQQKQSRIFANSPEGWKLVLSWLKAMGSK
jgi:RNA-directed DNA polymerase